MRTVTESEKERAKEKHKLLELTFPTEINGVLMRLIHLGLFCRKKA